MSVITGHSGSYYNVVHNFKCVSFILGGIGSFRYIVLSLFTELLSNLRNMSLFINKYKPCIYLPLKTLVNH